MSLTAYIVSAVSVFFFSALMVMVGLERRSFSSLCSTFREPRRYVRIKAGPPPVCIPCFGYEGKAGQ